MKSYLDTTTQVKPNQTNPPFPGNSRSDLCTKMPSFLVSIFSNIRVIRALHGGMVTHCAERLEFLPIVLIGYS